MRRLLLAAALFAAPAFAAPDPKPVMDADRAFAAMAKTAGPLKAFDTYLADDVVGMGGGRVSAVKAATLDEFRSLPAGFEIDWAPVGGAISDDGTLGATWGEWTRRRPGPDGTVTTLQGAYYTVWRKQPDGRWRAIVNGGTLRPQPKP